jgi:hypothetical protein
MDNREDFIDPNKCPKCGGAMKNDGGSAFPISKVTLSDDGIIKHAEWICGLTVRDYFAAKAMQGLLANPQFARILKMMLELPTSDTPHDVEKSLAGGAYEYADAMLEEREK